MTAWLNTEELAYLIFFLCIGGIVATIFYVFDRVGERTSSMLPDLADEPQDERGGV